MNAVALRALARRAGIAVEWRNCAGEPRDVADHVLYALLEALGYPCRTDDDLAESQRRLAQPQGFV
ncbi:MAG: hypothetical protein ACREF3_19150, partial [Acetobacteraceae bacterium]